MSGMFISFDGVDGVGKTTQLALLAEWLAEQGRRVITCRDPGSTPVGELIRELLLRRGDVEFGNRCEMLLYMAARAQLVEETIRPALAGGAVVLSDRFLLANIVYQGYAGGLDPGDIRQVGVVATGGLWPDLTVLLDMPAQKSLDRIVREADRLEQRGLEYMTKVRDGFLREAREQGSRVAIVDADRPPDVVQKEIRALVAERLPREEARS
jgi:dTMP kinase